MVIFEESKEEAAVQMKPSSDGELEELALEHMAEEERLRFDRLALESFVFAQQLTHSPSRFSKLSRVAELEHLKLSLRAAIVANHPELMELLLSGGTPEYDKIIEQCIIEFPKWEETKKELLLRFLSQDSFAYLEQAAKEKELAIRLLVELIQHQLQPARVRRGTRHKKWLRNNRMKLIAIPCLIGALVTGAVCYSKYRSPSGPNLAKGAIVTSSSTWGQFKSTSGLTDSVLSGVGAHTDEDHEPWFLLDLKSEKKISNIIVTNSDHCCEFRADPLEILVSDDGLSFVSYAKRSGIFHDWIARNSKISSARYIKVQIPERDDFLHLSEIEVY